MAYTELVRLLQIWLAWSLAFFFCIAAPAQAMSASKALANPLATKLDTHYFPINNTDPSGLFPYGETVPGEGAFGDLSGEPLESFKQENDMRRWPQSKWFTTNAETTMTWDQFKTSQSPSLLSEAQAVADEFFGAIKSNKGGVRDAVIAELKAITGPGSISVGDLQGRGIHSEESFGSINPFLNLTDGELMNAVNSPPGGDFITINTRTGGLSDGNTRARELLRRAAKSESAIEFGTMVRYKTYTPRPVQW